MSILKRASSASLRTASVLAVAAGGIASTLPVTSQAAATTSVNIPIPAMTTLDPTQWGYQVLLDQGTLLEGLYGYNQQNQIVPKIATGYKVSDGGKVWTFTLRHNAKWSNGKPVTAQDFYNSWMYTASPKNTASALWASVMTNVENAWSYHGGQVPASKVGLKVLGKYKIQLTLTNPGNILGMLPMAGSMPMYMPVVSKHPADWFKPQYFVGDGPYMVSSFTSNGNISLTRNTKYVGNSKEYNVGNVQQINIIPTPTVPVEDYMSGKLDAAMLVNPSDYKYAEGNATLKTQLHKQAAYQMLYLSWDKSVDASPLDNQKVRQAIAMVINRGPLAKAVLNGTGEATSAFGVPGWPTLKYEKGIPYNVKKAQQLLKEAGYPNGKGIPTLEIYTPTLTDNQNAVNVAEALAQEIKAALNINFQITPSAATLWDDIVYAGQNKGVKPGYVISVGQVNNMNTWFLTFQAIQWIGGAGVIGAPAYRKYVSNWYFPKYDPVSVKKYGNPDNVKMGMKWSDWAPLIKAFSTDNKYLNQWMSKQPAWYQSYMKPAPGGSRTDIWNGFVATWKSAKTAADKHNDWVSAWKYIGNYAAGNGNANVGLDGQVYEDKYEPKQQYQWIMEQDKLSETVNYTQAARLAGNLVNEMMQSGYVEPLAYQYNIFLEKPWLTGVQGNPWSFFNFYQLQYMKVKAH